MYTRNELSSRVYFRLNLRAIPYYVSPDAPQTHKKKHKPGTPEL